MGYLWKKGCTGPALRPSVSRDPLSLEEAAALRGSEAWQEQVRVTKHVQGRVRGAIMRKLRHVGRTPLQPGHFTTLAQCPENIRCLINVSQAQL